MAGKSRLSYAPKNSADNSRCQPPCVAIINFPHFGFLFIFFSRGPGKDGRFPAKLLYRSPMKLLKTLSWFNSGSIHLVSAIRTTWRAVKDTRGGKTTNLQKKSCLSWWKRRFLCNGEGDFDQMEVSDKQISVCLLHEIQYGGTFRPYVCIGTGTSLLKTKVRVPGLD